MSTSVKDVTPFRQREPGVDHSYGKYQDENDTVGNKHSSSLHGQTEALRLYRPQYEHGSQQTYHRNDNIPSPSDNPESPLMDSDYEFAFSQPQQQHLHSSSAAPWVNAINFTVRFMAKVFQGRHVSTKKGTTARYLWNQAMLTFLAALYFGVSGYLNAITQVITDPISESTFPERLVLPDVGFYLFPEVSWLSTDIVVVIPMALMFCRLAFTLVQGLIRKWCMNVDESTTVRMIAIPLIILKRIWLIHGSIFLLRSITIVITILPNPYEHCVTTVDKEVSLFWNALMVIAGQTVTCNDMFFSGHSIAITLTLMFWVTYSKERKFTYIVILPFSVICWWSLLATRYHYTLDVFFGILMSFMAWLAYHICLHIHFNHNMSPVTYVSSRPQWCIWTGLLYAFGIIEGTRSPIIPKTNPKISGQQHQYQEKQHLEKITNVDDLFFYSPSPGL